MKMSQWILLILAVWGFKSNAQLTVNNTLYTPSGLISNVLLPSGSSTSISNIQFIGIYNQTSRYQVGYFQTGTTTQAQMGFASGVMLTTGNTSEMPLALGTDPRSTQVSRSYTSCSAGEVRRGGTCPYLLNDLMTLAGSYNYYNTTMLEFDFVAAGSAVSFRYIFGSEEYMDDSGLINYQCSDYNDRFAFLLSGPGISGGEGYNSDAKNIARLSNGSIVSINSINNGIVGSSGGAPSASKCLASNAAWVNGSATADFLGTIDGTQMNGNTRIMTAFQSGLIPGQTYHIRLIIMDINDGAYDSVVYLEEASFTTEPTALPVDLDHFDGKCNQEGVLLDWATLSERNNAQFLLEKYNYEKQDFEYVTKINGAVNSIEKQQYTYTDKLASSGVNVYRLSQVDLNGSVQELKTIAVQNTCSGTQTFSANLNADQSFIITNLSDERQNAEISLVDNSGKIILNDQHLFLANTPYKLDNVRIASGLYFLQLKTPQTTEVIKLIVP